MGEQGRDDLRKKHSDGVAVGDHGGSFDAAGGVRLVELLLRVAPIGLCVAAVVVMLKNSESNDYGSISYSNVGGFKYLVYANGACAAYSLISAFYAAVPRHESFFSSWIIFLFDQVLTYLILAAGAVSTEIIYLAYNGDKDVTWSKACGVFGGFCHKGMASVGITFAAVVCYVVLSLISSYRLFSSYEAPSPSFSDKLPLDNSMFPASC